MNTFTQLFDEMIKNYDITLHQITTRLETQYHVLNRFKNGNGKRSAKLLKSILNVIPCEREKEEELYEALFREELEKEYGDNAYECIKVIKDILSIQFMSKDEVAEGIEMVKNSNLRENLSSSLFCKRPAVRDAVLLLLNQARRSSRQPVILWGLGTDTLLSDIAFAFHDTEISMEHLYPLMPAASVGGDLNNLKLMKQIMPCLCAAFDYNVRVVYEDYLSKEPFFLYECMLMTDTAALWIEKDYGHAQIVTDPQVLAFYRTRFENQYKNSKAALQRSADILEWQNVIYGAEKQGDICRYLSWQLCVMEFIPIDVLVRHIREEKKEHLAQALRVYEKRMQQAQKKKRIEYITLDGVKYFMDTGKILELPDAWYVPFSKEERSMVLKRVLEISKREYQAEQDAEDAGNLTIHLLNEKYFNLGRGIAIQSFSEMDTYMSCFEYDGRRVKFFVCEAGIKKWIFCLMEFLEESRWIYPLGEQIGLLEEVLKNIQQ